MVEIRTLMVDDSPEFLDVATRFLSIDPQIKVVAQLHLGQQVLPAIQQYQPDILLLDLSLPDLHGLDVISQVQEQLEHPPHIIVLTFYDNPEYRAQVNALGVDNFIYKSDFGVELLPTMHALMGNGDKPAPEDDL
jgi:DNA-binding NarL/FixJ family response regulator